jgi:hypothetical protein
VVVVLTEEQKVGSSCLGGVVVSCIFFLLIALGVAQEQVVLGVSGRWWSLGCLE